MQVNLLQFGMTADATQIHLDAKPIRISKLAQHTKEASDLSVHASANEDGVLVGVPLELGHVVADTKKNLEEKISGSTLKGLKNDRKVAALFSDKSRFLICQMKLFETSYKLQ